jgi:hypothetical protein
VGSKSYSKGITWIDDCRIPYTNTDKETINFDRPRVRELKENRDWILTQAHDFTNPDFKEYNTNGRFPANLLVCDDMLNDGNVVQSSNNWSKKTNLQSPYFTDERQVIQKDTSYVDKGTNSRYYDIDKWFDNLLNSCG